MTADRFRLGLALLVALSAHAVLFFILQVTVDPKPVMAVRADAVRIVFGEEYRETRWEAERGEANELDTPESKDDPAVQDGPAPVVPNPDGAVPPDGHLLDHNGPESSEEPVRVQPVDRTGTTEPVQPDGADHGVPPVNGEVEEAVEPMRAGQTARDAQDRPGRSGLQDSSPEISTEPSMEQPAVQPRRYIPPPYPEAARARGVEGVVVVDIVVGRRGRVEGVELVSSSGSEELDDGAVRAVRQWRFSREDEGRTTRHRFVFRLE